MNKFRLLSGSAFGSLALAGLLVASPAYAQAPEPVEPGGDPCQAPADQRDANCPPAGDENVQGATVAGQTGEGIVVVGSRIRRNQFNTADPIQVVTRDEATQAGFNSTAEILQSTAVTGGNAQINDTYGGFVTDGGPGANTLSLRGLGATRTLVLLNGRRVAPAGSRGSVGSADLNVLPNAIIDRIEILNTGASSIYGSDAIAGVVNIVTRPRIQGVTLEATHTVPEVGAGISQRYSLVAGASGERFNIVGSLEYFNRESLRFGDRDFLRCATQRFQDGSDYIDPETGEPQCYPLDGGGVTVNTIATNIIRYTGSNYALAPGFEALPSGYDLYCNRFRPNSGATGGVLPGFECVGGIAFDPTTGAQYGTSLQLRDTYSPAILQQDLISPAEIYTGFLAATYDTGILGNAEIYGELLVNRRNSSQDGQRQFSIDYPIGSPLLSPELRNFPVGSGIGIRAFTDFGIYNNRQTVDFVKASGGVRGDLPFNWRYDLYASRAWSDAEYTTDLILQDRLTQSMNVVQNADGSFSCVDTTGGCVAAPVLTPGVIAGNYQDTAWFDYIVDPVTGRTEFRETTYALTVDGPLFSLPGGSAAMAAGIEYRDSSINDQPSPESVRGNLFGFTSSTPTVGSDSVWEAFAEVELPILRDTFIHALTVTGSARYTEYESYGGDWTYKIGGLLSPTRWLSLRGSYGTSYRAPALFEQFQGATSGFLANTTDPCNNLFDVTNPLIRERCLAEGLPEGFIQNNSVTVIGLGGAESGLEAETSEALTFGAVLQPSLGSFGDLALAVDYFDILVENGVAQLSASAILGQCYNNPERTLCDTGLITREPYTGPGTGELTVIQSYVNIADARARGIDFTLRYSTDVGPGRFRLGAQVTHMLENYSRTVPTDDIVDQVGFIGTPEWSGVFDAAYQVNGWNFRWGVEWIQGTSSNDYLEQFGWDPAVYDYTIPDYFLHSASVRYETERFGFTVGVRNVFDEDPALISAENPLVNYAGNAPLQTGQDFRGRTFFVNTRFSF